MSSPRITLYHRDSTHEQPSGGLLWVLLDQLSDLPGGGSVALVRDGDDDDFIQAWRLPDGYRLVAQEGQDAPVELAHPVAFDAAFEAMLAWNLGRDGWREACEWRSPVPPPEPDTPPALIRIEYHPDSSRTDRLGRYADGQFLALVHGTRSNAPGAIGVALFLFDHTGTYTGSRIHNDVFGDAQALREQLIADLPDVAYGEIAIRTFCVREGDVTWELVDETAEYGRPRVSFYPMDIMFASPWDGTYST
ncbi:hypothetical protein [Catellatospora paridis]|uniref:hypothetical protein n=1 Tax=Catellatospora paridis TaxID=1617086 RepID=UPI0012D3A49B|nr:hypothetical protein [Catellatospora paridis]